jgi:hypothetical protein
MVAVPENVAVLGEAKTGGARAVRVANSRITHAIVAILVVFEYIILFHLPHRVLNYDHYSHPPQVLSETEMPKISTSSITKIDARRSPTTSHFSKGRPQISIWVGIHFSNPFAVHTNGFGPSNLLRP